MASALPHAWGAFAPDIDATDPKSTGGTFYNAPFANATNGGLYRVPFNKISPTAFRKRLLADLRGDVGDYKKAGGQLYVKQ